MLYQTFWNILGLFLLYLTLKDDSDGALILIIKYALLLRDLHIKYQVRNKLHPQVFWHL